MSRPTRQRSRRKLRTTDRRLWRGFAASSSSHGESFLALFREPLSTTKAFIFSTSLRRRYRPKAAAFLAVLRDLERAGASQFIIASHSPILMSYPGATVLSLDGASMQRVDYRETEHFQLTKRFLDNPELYFKHLFE